MDSEYGYHLFTVALISIKFFMYVHAYEFDNTMS